MHPLVGRVIESFSEGGGAGTICIFIYYSICSSFTITATSLFVLAHHCCTTVRSTVSNAHYTTVATVLYCTVLYYRASHEQYAKRECTVPKKTWSVMILSILFRHRSSWLQQPASKDTFSLALLGIIGRCGKAHRSCSYFDLGNASLLSRSNTFRKVRKDPSIL